MCLSGEVTEDELFSRLQQIKDGPEQQNEAPPTESGEDPVGKLGISSFLYSVVYYKIQVTFKFCPCFFRTTRNL